jgi:predicted HTH transcriptional regulator
MTYGGNHIIVLKIQGLSSPALYDEKYYERFGPNVVETTPRNIPALLARFANK